MTADSLDQLRADLLAEQPGAVEAASHAAAVKFLAAAIRYARAWRDSDDAMLGVRALAEGAIALKEAKRSLDREVKTRRREANYWRQSRDPVDRAATIWAALACGRPRCPCQHGKATHCPAHQDESPSFSVSVKDGRLLLHCHAGCSQRAVIDALTEMGLWTAARVRGGVA